MAIPAKVLSDGVGLTASTATYYTVPASTVTKVQEIILSNSHTLPVTVDIYFVPAGGTAAYTNQVFIGDSAAGLILAAKESKTIGLNTILTAGATIQAKASVATVIGTRISGYEMVG
jgi:hypothetical protein